MGRIQTIFPLGLIFMFFMVYPLEAANRSPANIDMREYQFDNPDWRGHILRKGCRDYCPEIKIDFVFLNDSVENQGVSEASLNNLITSFNHLLRGQAGQQLFHFSIGKIYHSNYLKEINCGGASLAELNKNWSVTSWMKFIENCKDPGLNSSGNITLFIGQSVSLPQDGPEFMATEGRLPMGLLGHKTVLEAGHIKATQALGAVFGLEKVCVPHATRNDPTPLMAASGNMELEIKGEKMNIDCPGFPGLRNQGLSSEEMLTMISSLKKFNRVAKKTLHYLHPGNR